MAEAAACDFDEWLKDTLVALDTDDEVFSPYIKGILEGEENADEKLDALQGILSEITVSMEVAGVDLWSCLLLLNTEQGVQQALVSV